MFYVCVNATSDLRKKKYVARLTHTKPGLDPRLRPPYKHQPGADCTRYLFPQRNYKFRGEILNRIQWQRDVVVITCTVAA